MRCHDTLGKLQTAVTTGRHATMSTYRSIRKSRLHESSCATKYHFATPKMCRTCNTWSARTCTSRFIRIGRAMQSARCLPAVDDDDSSQSKARQMTASLQRPKSLEQMVRMQHMVSKDMYKPLHTRWKGNAISKGTNEEHRGVPTTR